MGALDAKEKRVFTRVSKLPFHNTKMKSHHIHEVNHNRGACSKMIGKPANPPYKSSTIIKTRDTLLSYIHIMYTMFINLYFDALYTQFTI